ncbi:LuxR C-terminal-related transcriptional regulator [Microbacterium sp. 179-B 1A2 NHS]|uniref:LuxR C-terminal-related transcriptional regulator n=1 Tax=Microbacterium sp. 179-B 1A2 NHS TaxID=3142383 RepID=UPI00399F8848
MNAGFATTFGRASELHDLSASLGYARNRHAAAILVQGEAGIGKSVLLDELMVRIASQAPRVIRIAGYSSESGMPYAAVDLILRQLEGHLAGIPARQQHALAVATGRDVGAPPDRFHVGMGLLSLIGSLPGVTLLMVDDAHLVDQASLSVLAFVARRLRAESALLVFASRPDAVTIEILSGVTMMQLGGLDTHAALDLLRALSPGDLDPQVAVSVVSQLEGHPLAIADLARHTDYHRLALRVLSSEPLPPGALLQSLYQQEISALPEDSRTLALLAATDTTGDAGVVMGAARLRGLSAEAATHIELTGLLRFDGRVNFRHQLVRAAIYNAVPARDRRAAHDALEAASRDSGYEPAAALHAAATATPPNRTVADRLERLADAAGMRGALLTKAGMMLRSSEFSPPGQDRVDRAITASESAVSAGAALMARDILSTLNEADLTDEQRGRFLSTRALLSLFVADAAGIPHVPSTFVQASAALSAVSAEREQLALIDAFGYMLATDISTQGLSAPDLARRLLAVSGSSDLLGAVANGIGRFLLGLDDEGARAVRNALTVADTASDAQRVRLGGVLVALSSALWDPPAALGFAQRLIDVAKHAGALQSLDSALWIASTLHVRLLDINAAGHALENVRELRRAIGYPAEHVVNAAHLALTGAALEYADAAADATLQAGFGGAWVSAKIGIGVRLIADGRYQEAYDSLHSTLTTRFEHMKGMAQPELAEAAARSGRREEAIAAVDHLERIAQRHPTPFARGIADRSAALITAGDAAEDRYRSAISLLSSEHTSGDRARAHLLFGEWLRRERRRREAREHLATAARSFDALGASPFADRARREFAATGEHLPLPTSPSDLTPQEALVASLAEEGKSNQEIAVALFISPNTVDYHLRKVFRKLGVTSRRQLRDGARE